MPLISPAPRSPGPPGVPSRCQPACDADVAWAAAEKRLAEAWATGWAAVGFAASLGAALTLVGGGGGGRGRQGGGGAGSSGAASARSPPAVAFLALSHNLCAVGWAVRAAAGRRAVACSAAHALLMTRDGLANANCAVVFLLLYYFGTAASVWWVVLCLSWFLSAGGGWSAERVQQQSSLFHLAGWGLPAVCTVAVLVLRHVDADELTGSCYVGNHSARSLLVFVVVPQLAWLCAGGALLAAGWLGCRRRRGAAARMRTLGPDAKLNQGELCRLGALAGACAVPAVLSLVALLVEYGARRPHEAGATPLWAPLLRLAAGQAGAVAVAGWVWLCSPPPCRSLRAWRRLQPCKQPPPASAAPAPPPHPPPLYYQPAALARPPYQHAASSTTAQLVHLQHSAAHAAQPLLPAALGQHQPLLLPAAPAAHVHGGHKPARKHRSSKHTKHGSETTV
ncbi:frizzled-9-like [Schistocerca cancellata]|uniref:frizzled-9-like n=1 Tax=Schistocerca cancellata TaxID=274614 RepID=UPI0021191FF4|nr:frizzled-9-like [Schistocerca cancellata]